MTGAELAALITALGVSVAGIMTAIAALMNARNSADKIVTLQKENEHLRAENEKKGEHNDFQDQVILNQQLKIEHWQQWGDRIGRKLNEMQLQIGSQQRQITESKTGDTHPLQPPPDRDWITGPLGPLDINQIKDDR